MYLLQYNSNSLDKNNKVTNRRPKISEIKTDPNSKTAYRFATTSRQTTIQFPNVPEGSLLVGQKETFNIGLQIYVVYTIDLVSMFI